MKLETERLILRDLEETDLKNLVNEADNLEVSKYLALVPNPYDEKDGEWFINHCKEESKKEPRENYELAITLKENNNLIGIIGLTKVDEFNGTATIGYWLGQNHWKKGIMSEAVKRIIEFAFSELNLRRIDIEGYTENEGTHAIIKKFGFKEEGLRKEFTKAKSTGKLHDIIQYGLLKKDWEKQ